MQKKQQQAKPSRKRAAAALAKPPAQRTPAEQEEIVAREAVVDRYESLVVARWRLTESLAYARSAHELVAGTGLAPAHILEPLRTVIALLEQSHARVVELLNRVPI